MSDTLNKTYVEHLQGMIRIPTISDEDDSRVDFSRFEEFHRYLEDTYPLIHQKLEKRVIGKASLLYRWNCGRKTEKLPLLLMAHQDVVPAGNAGNWTHDPFGGEIADGCIWGRGAVDCKNVILGVMEAAESLLAEGFEPDFDLYLAFGHNEEVHSSSKGALQIVEELQKQNITLGAVFDEGFGVRAVTSKDFSGYICEVNLGEKASQDYELFCECDGGHSMEPGNGTALGSIARAIVEIENHPFPYRLLPVVREQLKAMSHYVSGEKKEIYRHPEERWAELCHLAGKDRKLDALLRTTCAVTMAQGSSRSNILPARASAVLNCRLLSGDDSESVLRRIRELIPENVQIRKLSGDDPGRITSVEASSYRLIEKIEKQRFGENLIMVPGLLAGGTDAKFYGTISRQVIRYSGFILDERWGPAHGVDEKIPCDTLYATVDFYRELIRSYM